MAIAFRRSIRQAISFVASGAAAYLTWMYTRDARIFSGFVIEEWLCIAAAIGVFFVAFYVVMLLLKSKAAR
ncbi:hypothetical protein JXA47_02620 [Candidatus Sumerlaeota bacterium]|nr:hypothetical protein [Candidatus Sumerlaeota bacterium]